MITQKSTTETLLSPYTNKPVTGTTVFKIQLPVYWCPLCCKKLPSPAAAHQHITGKAHKNKGQDNNKATTPKRRLDGGPTAQEPVGKKMKEQLKESDPDLQCVDCNLVFNSVHDSIQHFKHTSHSTPKSGTDTINQNILSEPSNGDVSKKDDVMPVQLKCELCNLVFQKKLGADEHFQGKRHKKAVLVKEAAEQRKVLNNWQARKPTVTSRGRGNGRAMGRGFVKPTGGTTASYQKGNVLPGFVKASHGVIWGDQTNIEQGVASSSSNLPTYPNNYSPMAYVSPLQNNSPSNFRHDLKRDLPANTPDNTQQGKLKNEDRAGGQNTSYNTPYNQSYYLPIPAYPSQPKEQSSFYKASQERADYADQKGNENSTSTTLNVEQSNHNNYGNYNTVSSTLYSPSTLNTPGTLGTNNYYNNYTSQNALPPATPYFNNTSNANYSNYQRYY